MLVEFVSREGNRRYRTLEEVNLYPPGRVTFLHLEGPLHYSSEEFRLLETPLGTLLTYRGTIECRMPFLPGFGWLVAMLYVRPKYRRLVRRHMLQMKESLESENESQ